MLNASLRCARLFCRRAGRRESGDGPHRGSAADADATAPFFARRRILGGRHDKVRAMLPPEKLFKKGLTNYLVGYIVNYTSNEPTNLVGRRER